MNDEPLTPSTDDVGGLVEQPSVSGGVPGLSNDVPAVAGAVPATASWLEQDTLLRELWGRQLQPPEIAEKLGRSVAAVMTRAARLGLPRRFAPGRKAGQRYEKTLPMNAKKVSVARSGHGEKGVWTDPDVPAQPAVMRVCLMCLKKFESEGRHNRICPSCKGSPEYAAGSRIPDINFGSGV